MNAFDFLVFCNWLHQLVSSTTPTKYGDGRGLGFFLIDPHPILPEEAHQTGLKGGEHHISWAAAQSGRCVCTRSKVGSLVVWTSIPGLIKYSQCFL